MKTFLADGLDGVKIMGRAAQSADGIDFFWTASGFEVNAKASELRAEIFSDWDALEIWISVFVDGFQTARLMLNKGRNDVCLFRNLNAEKTKNVRVYKETQAMGGDRAHRMLLKSLSTDGDLLAVPPRPLKMEFIGDSITSGEGAVGADCESDWTSLFFGGTKTYAFLLAQKLRADFSVLSQSGWGVVSGYDCDLRHALPDYYEEVCSILPGAAANQKWDFKKFRPDYVVVNLGTNDQNPCVARSDISERFEPAVISFLKKIRAFNPNARIVWCYGMMGQTLAERIRRAVGEYQAQSGDKKVQFVLLEQIDGSKAGALGHPSQAQHEAAAEFLRSQIVGL